MKFKQLVGLFVAIVLVTVPAAWSGAYYAVTNFHMAMADPPTGNGGVPGILGATDTSLTQTNNTLGLSATQPNAEAWSASQTFNNFGLFSFDASSAGISGSPVAPLVIGSTGTMPTDAIGICSVAGCGATTAANSGAIAFQGGTGSASATCPMYYSGTLNEIIINCRLTTNNNPLNVGTTYVQTDGIYNSNANSWNGTCASVASGFHCVTGNIGLTAASMTCEQEDTTNHAVAVDVGVTLTSGSAYTFTSTIPDAYVGTTLTAPTTGDTVVWWCRK